MNPAPRIADPPARPDLPHDLVDLIKRGECAVFIGAGISVPAGYPGLQDLLHSFAEEADIDGLRNKPIDDNWMQDFQEIRDRLGPERYRASLLDHFDHRSREIEFNPILLDVLSIPFCAFVTTNYDPCLEFAARKSTAPLQRNSFSYPNLPVVELKGKHIFHPHGYIEPDNPDSVTSVVLTQADYEDAYDKYDITSGFFRRLFAELDVLFLGFGWTDFVLLGTIETVKRSRAIREDFASERALPLARQRHSFALIDSETLLKDQQGRDYLGRLGVTPIVYPKSGTGHNQLIPIVRYICEEATGCPAPPIPTLPDGFLQLGDAYA